MNDRRADQLKDALRHQKSVPVSDAVRKREMDEVRNYNRKQQQKVFNLERRQANAYTQETKDPSPEDVGSSFKLQQYIGKLNALLQQKSDIYSQLKVALPSMTTPEKLRGASGEARASQSFLSRGEIDGAFNEMMSFITSYFGDINLNNRVREAIYQQFLTPLTAQFRETATLFPRFIGGIPPARARQADFTVAKTSLKEEAELIYSMMRVMADYIEDGIFRSVSKKDIDLRMKEEDVPAMFDAVVAGAPVPEDPLPALQPAPAINPLAPAQNVPPIAQQGQPPTRDELAQGISAQEEARRQALPAIPQLPAPPAQPAQPALNPQAPPFPAPVQQQPAQIGDPLQNLGDTNNATAERVVVLSALNRLNPARFPGVGNRPAMTQLGQEIMNDPTAQGLGFDGTPRQTSQALTVIYGQQPARLAGTNFNAVPLQGFGHSGARFSDRMMGGEEHSDAENEGEDESAYLPMGIHSQEELEKLFTPQAYDPKNPMMFMAGQGQPSGGHYPPKGFLMRPDGSLKKGKGLSGGSTLLARMLFPGTSLAYDMATGKNPLTGDGLSGGDGFDDFFSGLSSIGQNNDPPPTLGITGNGLSGGVSLADVFTPLSMRQNPDNSVVQGLFNSALGSLGKSLFGGCADCKGEGRARHRTAPTKRHLIGGQPQGVASRMAMINPDTEIMDAGLMKLKGMGVVDSDMVGRARPLINTPYPEQPYYGYGIDGDEDETGNLTGLKARLGSGISYGAGRAHRADNMFGYDPVADDYYENTGAEEELAGEGYIRDEYEEPKDMDDDPNPFRVRQENYRIATGRQKRPTYNYVKA
jgi:hypothetical protein